MWATRLYRCSHPWSQALRRHGPHQALRRRRPPSRPSLVHRGPLRSVRQGVGIRMVHMNLSNRPNVNGAASRSAVDGLFASQSLHQQFGSVRNRLLTFGLEQVDQLLNERGLEHEADFEFSYDWRAVDDVDRVVVQLVQELRDQGVNVEQMGVQEFERQARDRILHQLPMELEVEASMDGPLAVDNDIAGDERDTVYASSSDAAVLELAGINSDSAEFSSDHMSWKAASDADSSLSGLQKLVAMLVSQNSSPLDEALDPQLYKAQLEKELHSISQAEQAYTSMVKELSRMKRASFLSAPERMIAEWFGPLKEAVEQEISWYIKQKPGPDRRVYGPYLAQLKASLIAVIVMHETVNACLSMGNEVKVTQLALDIGTALNAEAGVSHLRNDRNLWKRWRKFTEEHPQLNVLDVERFLRRRHTGVWSQKTRAKVGAAALDLLIKVCKVEEADGTLVPAFTRSMPAVRLKRIGLMRMHPRALALMEGSGLLADFVSPQHKPMVIAPRPWTSYDCGGYLSVNSLLMRVKLPHDQVAALRKMDLTNVFTALNTLAQTPWRINERVLDVVERCWAAGGGVAGLTGPSITLPADPTGSVDAETLRRHSMDVQQVLKENAELHALRCDTNLKLGVAREFRNVDFYYPYNVDFRGRVYPIPPHLNHIGDDLSRGLMRFARGYPLGKRGLRWLKVQFANMCGNDKLSFDGRVEFTDSRIRAIHMVAADPFDEECTWWMEQENPWQCLAVCFELSDALSHPEPELFVSHLPVHQDGSCNGLQHYAALGRDEVGGQSVNLLPADKPQDVYSAVCDLVSAEVARDAVNSAAEAHELAKLVTGKVTRKVVKQTVMTSVYGVKLIGARKQIEARLAELTSVAWPDRETRARTALYLAKVTLNSLGNMFNGARAIMTWLVDVAALVASRGQPMSWVTPMGLPVVQPYRKESLWTIKTVLQSCTLSSDSKYRPVSAQKQMSAFPPNFVHSLDSTHMMLTALDCKAKGIEFVSVHDSFWTHAGTVDIMNDSLREQFVNLYSEPILENLRSSLELQYPDVEFPPLPRVGALDIKQVRKAAYFFN